MYNYGFQNELDFVKVLNNKRVGFLSPFPKQCIITMFEQKAKPLSKIKAKKLENFEKADISVTIDNVTKYVSIKSGRATYIHSGYLENFVLFLRELGVSLETQKTIVLYHYGDDTLDGTGKIRYSYEELTERYKERIKKANEELSDKRIISAVMERFVFGVYPENEHSVDYLLLGYVEHGIIVSKEEVMRFVNKKSFGYLKALHIGPLYLQPYLRDIERKSNNPEKRKIIKLEWKYIDGDLNYISNNKVTKKDDFL